MRKILIFTRNGIAACRAVRRQVSLIAFGASLTVTLCCSRDAVAQSMTDYVIPTAAMNFHGAPVSANPVPANLVSGASPENYQLQAASQADYSVDEDATDVELAGYRGGGLFAGGRNYFPPNVTAGNVCAPGCDVSWYANYEALWLRREGDEFFSLSRNTFMPDFNYEFGGRYTIGRLLDCVNGWEAVYTGPFDWQRQQAVLGTASLQSRFVPVGGYTGAEVSTFNDADQHVQAWRARLNSFELNRRWWTWDVLSTMIGVRYVDYKEEYLFLSNRPSVGNGVFNESTNNRMVGLQMGADMMYPVNLRTNVGFRSKAGIYANFDEATTFMSNAGTTILAAGQTDVDVAGLIETGVFVNYQLVPSVRLTAGYEIWYLPGVATVPSQNPRIVSPLSGNELSNADSLFLHGGSLGVQVLF